MSRKPPERAKHLPRDKILVWRKRGASCPSFRGPVTAPKDRRGESSIMQTSRHGCKRVRTVSPGGSLNGHRLAERPARAWRARGRRSYLMIFATTPAPTVRPPSRIAKRRPSSIATGLISDTCIFTLSPGITISVPSGSVTAPVMSVVRK